MSKTISLIVPTIGRIDYLDELITSALNQTIKPDEFIVFDNSVEQDLQIKSKFGNNSNVKWKKSGRQLNAIDSWNNAFLSGKCEYVLTTGDDDVLMPNYVENAKKMVSDGCEFGLMKAVRVDEQGKFESSLFYPETESLTAEEFRAQRMKAKVTVLVPGMLFKREFFAELQGYKNSNIESLAYSDELLAYRLSCKSKNIFFSKEICWKYRFHAGQISGVKTFKDFVLRAKAFQDFMSKEINDICGQTNVYPYGGSKDQYLFMICKYGLSQFVKNYYKDKSSLTMFKLLSTLFKELYTNSHIRFLDRVKLFFLLPRMLIQFSEYGRRLRYELNKLSHDTNNK